MKHELILCDDKKLWDDFVAASPQNNIFCTTKFLDNWLYNYSLYFVKRGNIVLLGAVICMDNSGKPIVPQFVYHGVMFGGLVYECRTHKRTKVSLDLIDYFLAELDKKYKKFSFSLYHTFDDVRSFQWFNYHEPDKGLCHIDINYTGILELKGISNFEELLMSSRTVRRQEYRKCVKEGFIIEESNNVNILQDLHGKTFSRQNLDPDNVEKFLAQNLAKSALNNGFGRLNICKDNTGHVASASLFLFDDTCGYYLVGANDPQFRNYGVSAYLIYDQIKYFMEKGLKIIDFVGINSPLRGDFKTSFNAVPTPYYSITR